MTYKWKKNYEQFCPKLKKTDVHFYPTNGVKKNFFLGGGGGKKEQ